MARGAERKADVVSRDLLEQIVRGDLAVGSLLPREAELAAAYGVNRSVVREAIKLLEVHRLVRPTRRLGTVVLDPMASLTPEVLRAMLVRRDAEGARVDVTVLAGLLEIRAGLDVQMAALAAERRTKADLAALDAEVARARTTAGDPAAFADALAGFALQIARATKNPLFEMMAHWNASITSEHDVVFGTIRSATGPHIEGLAVLAEAIRHKDAEGARQLVGAFHAWATPRLLAAAELANGDASVHLRDVSRPSPKSRAARARSLSS